MHRTSHVPPIMLGSLLLGLALAGPVSAQEPPPPPAPPDGAAAARSNNLVIPINGTQRVQMTTRRRITQVRNPKDTVARVQAVPGDPTSVLVTGLDAGITRVTLVDENGAQ